MKKFCCIVFVFLFFLTACDHTSEETTDRVLYYETNEYEVYQRLAILAARSEEGQSILLNEEPIVWNGKDYYWCEAENITLYVSCETSAPPDNKAEYLLFQDGELIYSTYFRGVGRSPLSVALLLIDITKDGKKDVIIKRELISGTPAANSTVFGYDIAGKCEMNLFDKESGDLTEIQSEQLAQFLDGDKQYQKLFKNCWIGTYGCEPFFDTAGNVYYEAALWNTETTIAPIFKGEVMMLFDYDTNKNEFVIADVLYREE